MGTRAPIYVAVNVLPFTVQDGQLKLLLVRRSTPPFEGQWAVPGGFLGETESADEAARRKVRERAGVCTHLEQLHAFTRIDRDPRRRVISISYLAVVPVACMNSKEENRDLFAVSMKEEPDLQGSSGILKLEDLAFDHGEMIAMAVAHMQEQVGCTDLVFDFMDPRAPFSMLDLYGVFSAVLGKNMDRSNFNRMIRNRYQTTGRLVVVGYRQGECGRPAELFQMRRDVT